MPSKKLAIVTGAARGLGFAVASDLAAADCRVLMIGRRREALDTAVARLQGMGKDVVAHVADVTVAAEVAALAERLHQEFRRADILVNNAGVFLEPNDFMNPRGAGLLEVTPDTVAATFVSNALAPLRLIQAVAPLMLERGWGRIVNVSSGMGQLKEMGGLWPGYRMSKTALNALTRIAANELQHGGIKVNAVCPGWCRTDMGGKDAERSADQGAAGIVWAARLPDDGPTGGFFRDGKAIDW